MKTNHSFHIPVMGTGFTIDTPIKVARFGISSAVSLVDDYLIEKMREYYSNLYHEAYEPILHQDPDRRANRITAYLNLMDRIVKKQVLELKREAFVEGSEISKYFELLDEASFLKQEYKRMLQLKDAEEKASLESRLRNAIVPGAIDVNIMTKADRDYSRPGEKLAAEKSDAMAALRGFAKSTLNSSIVFSAGLNLHLYGYVAHFEDFLTGGEGEPKKKIILKVSDFRSALVQGKIFAKKGVWVSEYRIESGLNCGGHAFPAPGHLMGPILEEFKRKKEELKSILWELYQAAMKNSSRDCPVKPFDIRFSAQGGIGTSAENRFLLRRYELEETGWGSPFLLVPEATGVDPETLQKLVSAKEEDIYLSNVSPLGVPFYTLRNSASEEAKEKRIKAGNPGSPCANQYLAFNTEFGTPLCIASHRYQTNKIKQLREKNLDEEEFLKEFNHIVEKSCICHDLGDGVLTKYGIDCHGKEAVPAVCPGPNLAYFTKICSLKEMVGHIYGRWSVLKPGLVRSHFFINELKLYIDYLKDHLLQSLPKASQKEAEYFSEFKNNLLEGIEYYKTLVSDFLEETEESKKEFLESLLFLREGLEKLSARDISV